MGGDGINRCVAICRPEVVAVGCAALTGTDFGPAPMTRRSAKFQGSAHARAPATKERFSMVRLIFTATLLAMFPFTGWAQETSPEADPSDGKEVRNDDAERERQAAAAIAKEESAFKRLTKEFGAEHWKVTDARVALQSARLWYSFTETQRKQSLMANRLGQQSRNSYRAGRSREAIRAGVEQVRIYRDVWGEWLNTGSALADLARVYDQAGEYSKAQALYQESLGITRKVTGENHPAYGTILNNFAVLCRKTGDHAQAEALHLRSLNIRRKTLGEVHPACALTLRDLAILYESMGEFAKAEPLLLQSIGISRKTLGEEHREYAVALLSLAGLYRMMGEYKKARTLFVEGSEIQRRALGEEHPVYATTLNNFAILYESMGDYEKAEMVHLQCIKIRRKTLGEDHPGYATTLGNLGVLYRLMGDYAKAEPLQRQCLQILRKTVGVNHPDCARTLSNLGLLYQSMGDYAKAEPLYLECLQICRQTLGEDHPGYATTLNNLATLSELTGNYAKAGSLYLESLKTQRKVLGENHPKYAMTLDNLARLYISIGDYAKAEGLCRQCLEIRRRTLGEAHPDFAMSQSRFAGLYQFMGDYAKAEPLYLQSLKSQRLTLGEQHPTYMTNLFALAVLYQLMGDYAKAEELASHTLELSQQLIERTAVVLSERQQMVMNQMLRCRLDGYISLALESGQFQESAARKVLEWKGATLVRQRAMRLAAADPTIADQFRELQSVARRLASLSRTSANDSHRPWRKQFTALTAEKEELESQISRENATFHEATKVASFDQIQAALPDGGVLVDYFQFIRLRPPDGKGRWQYKNSLLGIVVRQEGDPVMLDLGAVAPLSEAVDTWRASFESWLAPLGRSRQGIAAGRGLRQSIWEPVLKYVADAQTVLVSTDGVLGRIPLGALPGKKPGSFLIEDHRLAMIPVPQLLPKLADEPGQEPGKRELLLVGDVDYGSATQESGLSKKPHHQPYVQPEANFLPLPGTAREIAGIAERYDGLFKTDGNDVTTLKGIQATEARFRQLAPQFRNLHLATHGFFAPPEKLSALSSEVLEKVAGQASLTGAMLVAREAAVTGTNPGLLSGLVFAGANEAPQFGKDDGILTAQEIGFLPLRGVDTVVLSACETGLGPVAGGEGLLGVQRAFQVAGVRTTVASFWSVDDLVTSRLMERFYQNLWQEKMTRLDALREAQLWLLNTPAAIRGTSLGSVRGLKRVPPFYWAAFTLSGDWR